MRRQTLAALGLVPALALGVPACGGDGTGGSGATAEAASDTEKMREFAQCMRDNGVDMPDPSSDGKVTIAQSARPGEAGGPGGPGGNDRVAAAQEKCRHLMPNGGKPKKMKPEDVAKMRAFSACMRDSGISEFPDPDSDGRMLLKAGPGTGIDLESSEFKAAQKACAKLRPEGDDGPGTDGKAGD
ncbi:hypothetical protein E1281_09165 [Actinomadura sp. KC345]|uniref:hypothetical protein n=1 Tax=Actinomadura sp. KC345 TaxID=2530371 RepID=UPI00104596A8|nr:hypothetical protein [Actinomadura sp. KC345]TDC56052.1 hypothetical protein E1281_09165 [Actinomadura sp. KC345]